MQQTNTANLHLVTSVSVWVSLLTTFLWIAFMIIDANQHPPLVNPTLALTYMQHLGWLHYVTYVNAVLITFFAALFCICLFFYCQRFSSLWAFVGLAFIPVYSVLNLVAYGSQITLLPQLVSLLERPEHRASVSLWLPLLLQSYQPVSITGIINVAAYAILGIPSILFGWILFRNVQVFRATAVLLILNGLACILGIIGVGLQNQLLIKGCMLGGVLYLAALACCAWVLAFQNKSLKLE